MFRFGETRQGCVASPSGRPLATPGNRRPRWMTVTAARTAVQNSAYRLPRWHLQPSAGACLPEPARPSHSRARPVEGMGQYESAMAVPYDCG